MTTSGLSPAFDLNMAPQDASCFPAAIFSALAGTFCCRLGHDLSPEICTADLVTLTGYTAEELQSLLGGRLLDLLPAEHRENYHQKLSQQLTEGDDVEIVWPMCRKDGSLIWALNKSRRVIQADGSAYLCGMMTDVTRSKVVYDELTQELTKLNIILAQTENIIFEWDLTTDTVFFSDTWKNIFGYQPITKNFGASLAIGSHLHPDDVPLLFEHLQTLRSGTNYQAIEARIARDNGEYLWCRFRATAISDKNGRITKLVGIIINVDEEKKATAALQNQAQRDSLTKLYNNETAKKKASSYLNTIHSSMSKACSLLIIDLDNFKNINDQHGHMFGDTVLAHCAKTIRGHFRPSDMVARIGGDEFLVLMKDVSDRALVEERCSELIAAFRTILQPDLQDTPLSCSIGIASAPDHGLNYYDLFVAADRALYHAKGLGKNQFAFYTEDLASLPTQKRFISAVNQHIESEFGNS